MKIVIAVFCVLSLAAHAKPGAEGKPTKDKPTKELVPPSPDQLMEDARLFFNKGELEKSKKAYDRVIELYDKKKIAIEAGEDPEASAQNPTYGELARGELKPVEKEIEESKTRVLTSPKKSLTEIFEAFKTREASALGAKMWTRVHVRDCNEEEGGDYTPKEAVDELSTWWKVEELKVKQLSLTTGGSPTLKLALDATHKVEVKLSKYKGGWIWNHMGICLKE